MEDAVHQVTTNIPYKKQRHITDIPGAWEIDLVVMMRQADLGYRYILVCIEIATRFAVTYPLKDKMASNVLASFKHFCDHYNPSKIVCDRGSEFAFKNFQSYCIEKGIILYFVEIGNHRALGIIDRFVLTLRTLLQRHWLLSDSNKWVDALPSIIETYNNTKHGSIEMSPIQARNNMSRVEEIQKQIEISNSQVRLPHFSVGDIVRFRIPKQRFNKEKIYWSKDVYQISARKGNRYNLKGYPRSFSCIDLVKAVGGSIGVDARTSDEKPEIQKYEIGRFIFYDPEDDTVQVRWAGYSAKDDTWEPREQLLVDLGNKRFNSLFKDMQKRHED